ncbi:MAG: hypothetical protein ACI9KE_006685, partial [Polyangiales bacterium]
MGTLQSLFAAAGGPSSNTERKAMSTFLLLGLTPFSWLGGSLISFVMVFVLALGGKRFFRERFHGVRANLVRSPVLALVRGFMISALAIGSVALLIVTVIGIPLA